MTNEPNFDVATDFMVFARNDPQFYSKEYYPCMSKCSDILDMKKPLKRGHFMPMIKKGAKKYCEKYDLGSPNEVFDKSVVDAIIQQIKNEELPLIKQGEYRCR